MASQGIERELPPKWRELLIEWELGEYCEAFEENELVEIEYWSSVDKMALNIVGMKKGAALKFLRNARLLDDVSWTPAYREALPTFSLDLLDHWRLGTYFGRIDGVIRGLDLEGLGTLDVEDLVFVTGERMSVGEAVRFLANMRLFLSPIEESKENVEIIMESTWIPMFTRENVQPRKKRLDDCEALLHRSVVLEMMEVDLNSPVWETFMDLKPKNRLDMSVIVLQKEFRLEFDKCRDDPDYFKNLVIFAKHTSKSVKYDTVLHTYKLKQEEHMNRDPEEWVRGISNIEAISSEVRGADGSQSFQPQQLYTFTIIDPYRYAVVAQNLLRVLLTQDVGDGLNPEQVFVPHFKSLYRIAEILAISTQSFRAYIPDMSRGSISFDSMADIIVAIERLRGIDRIEVVKVENHFARVPLDAWQDVLIHIRFLGQPEQEFELTAEIQFCLQDFTDVRRGLGGSGEYSEVRSALEILRRVDPDGRMEAAISW